MKTIGEARDWLDRFARALQAQGLFGSRICNGKDGKPLPDNGVIGDYWTDAEADDLFERACNECGISEEDYQFLVNQSEADRLSQLRKACDLLGITKADRERLEKINSDL